MTTLVGAREVGGDIDTQLALLEADLRLVVSIARKYERLIDETGHRLQLGALLVLSRPQGLAPGGSSV